MSPISRFFAEVQRRRVLRVVALYIVGSWVVLQVADLALESFGFPDQALKLFWIALIAGFPLALFFGWRYDISAKGITRTAPADPGAKPDLSLKAADYGILGALVAVAVLGSFQITDQLGRIDLDAGTKVAEVIAANTIAVLPLDNLTGDPDQEYLSMGLHSALITSLSKISSLRITSPTSSRRVDRNISMSQIAGTLGVAKLVEGSVMRDGNKVRVNVQLIDANTDENLWAESYDRDFTDLLSLQNEIARAVARAVQAKLLPKEEVLLVTGQTVNPDTYEAYLRGMFQLHKESSEGYRRGIEIMTEAVENDPGSALTYAGLGYGHAKLGHNVFGVVGAAPRAKAAATRALELDDNLAEAYLAMGMYYLYYEWDWVNVEKHLFRALELNPSLTAAHYHLAWYYELLNDHEKALYHGEMTKTLDPLSPFYTSWLADQYRSAGMYEEAIAEANTTLAFTPGYPVAWLVLGMTYAEKGELDKSIDVLENLRDFPFFAWALAAVHAAAGNTDETKSILESYGDNRRTAFAKSVIYAALGDREQLLKWTQVTKEEKLAWYPWLIAWFPGGRIMYEDPRWQELADELDLELPAA